MTLSDILAALYDSEINVSLSSFWDAGWRARLGDDMNGFCAEVDADTLDEMVPKLSAVALVTYPDSVFAKSERWKAA